jgi:hypothetical protein
VRRKAALGPSLSEHKSYTGLAPLELGDARPTRHRRTREELRAAALKGSVTQWGEQILLNPIIRKDPAWETYKQYREHSDSWLQAATNAARLFLTHLGRPVTETALTELLTQTRREHREDIYTTDDALIAFSRLETRSTHGLYAGAIKGIFRANHCPLTASIKQPQARKEKRISAGILKAIYQALPREELRLLADLGAFAPERAHAIYTTPISAWEDFNQSYTLIRFDPSKTKVNYEHIGIIPRQLADRIRAYAKQTGRYPQAPFPNYETLWAEITKLALSKFGIRLTSKYLRKEFTAKAKKTPMPPNDWDFLAGHKQKIGNQAHHYDPEDDASLVREYDKYLAPYLGMNNTREPDEAGTPFKDSETEQLRAKVAELTEQILQLTKLLTKQQEERA